MMVALLLYCYATGTRSSRKIMRRCQVDVACRVIVAEDTPDFRTISDFRKIHLARLEALFVEVLKLCAWPAWPGSAPSPWMGPRSRPTPRGTRR